MSFPLRSRAVAGLLLAGALTSTASFVAAVNPMTVRAQAEAARPGIGGMLDPRLVVLADQEARASRTPSRLAVTSAEREVISTDGIARNAAGDVSIRIHAEKPALLVDELAALGATNIIPVPDAYLVECYIPVNRLADLPALATLGLKGATANFKPITNIGTVTSQADWIMEADRTRFSVPGYDGTGVRIGTLSDSFGESGDPTPDTPFVDVLQDAEGTDEGRAMIELMYDLAPGAGYAFATALGGEANFAQNVLNLANPNFGNCRVVVDDIGYFAEPFWQNSLVGRAVNQAANTWDTVYLSAAGNSADRGWEVYYPSAGAHPVYGGSYLDLDPTGSFDIVQSFYVKPQESIRLIIQWDDPFYTLNGVDTDLDVYLIPRVAGSDIERGIVPGLAGITDNIQVQMPVEIVSYFNDTGTGVVPSTPTPTPAPTATPGPNPFNMNGTIDAAACELGNGLFLAEQGGWLYIATDRAVTNDAFIFVADVPGTTVPVPSKTGQVAAWDFYLFAEESDSTFDWYDNTGAAIGESADRFFARNGSILEGAIRKSTVGGGISAVAMGLYGTADGGALLDQEPTAVLINGNIEAGEYSPVISGFDPCTGTGGGVVGPTPTPIPAQTVRVDMLVQRWRGPNPARIKYIQIDSPNVPTSHPRNSGTIQGHPAAENAISVGAIDYFNQNQPASFTSWGPNFFIFNDAGQYPGFVTTRDTPTLSAIQRTNTTFFGGGDVEPDGFPNFAGTSAAAPHAAAVAALYLQRFPGASRTQVRNSLIGASDNSIGTPGFDYITGHGSLNAYDAVFGPSIVASNAAPIVEGLESGALPRFFDTRTTNNGRLEVSGFGGPASGTRHLLLDAHPFLDNVGLVDTPSRNEFTLRVNLAGRTNAVLTFDQREFSDTDEAMPAQFATASNTDGVAYSVDGGNTWRRLMTLTGNNSTNTYQTHVLNLSALAAGQGVTLGADTRIRFQQYGTLPIPFGGMAFDNIQLTSNGPAATPTPTPTPTPGGPTAPSVRSAGLSVNVTGGVQQSFVAYFVRQGNAWVYQGDSGWQPGSYDITFQNWPYATLPLRLQGYRGIPELGVAGINPIGSTTLMNGTITRINEPAPGGQPVVGSAGLSVNIDSPDSNPYFVAYYVRMGNNWVYQGDTGWKTDPEFDVTFPNWPYSTLPLRLQAFRGEPSIGVTSLQAIGSTSLVGGTITKAAQ